MEDLLRDLAANATNPDCPSQGSDDDVTWVGVGIAASLIAFNGNKENKETSSSTFTITT